MMFNDPYESLKAYVNQPSGSLDQQDVTKVAMMFRADFESLGFQVQVNEGKKYGPHLICTIGTGEKNLMLMGHMDTVFPHDLAYPYTETEDGRILGSGVVDMKGGVVVMLYALREALPQIDLKKYRLTVVLNADEEVGSSESHEAILENAKKAFAALSFEPAGADGRMTCARKGVTSVLIHCKGKAGHAGAEYTRCASAIQALCAQITALYALRDDDREISFNAGLISGGTAENVVAPEAQCKCEFRYFDQSLQKFLMQKIEEIVSREPVPGVTTDITFGASHPAVDVNEKSLALFKLAQDIAAEQGRTLYQEKTGGAGDIAIAGQAGVGVLDGFGLYGGGMHTVQEFALRESLPKQIRLAAEMLKRVCC